MSKTMNSIAEAVSEYITPLNDARIVSLVAGFKTFTRANDEIRQLTGIRNFFDNAKTFDEFQTLLRTPARLAGAHQTREWGDFQTPPDLAMRVCEYLAQTGVAPNVIVEPTFGVGSFISSSLRAFPQVELVYGVEIQSKHFWHHKIALLIKALLLGRARAEIELHCDDVFEHKFSPGVLNAPSVLVIGNPPWVTNAELGVLKSSNLPAKQNLKSLNGIDAITGKSNFDLGEFIILRMLDLFSNGNNTLAMLCKNSVIKNLVEFLPTKNYRVANTRALKFDAKREFNVSVEASLLVLELGRANSRYTCAVASLAEPHTIEKSFGWTNGKFVSNVDAYAANARLDGKSPFEWRQGVKHDCSAVMELEPRNAHWVNKDDETVGVEEQYVYWLLKGSDLRGFVAASPRRKIIVTQRKPGEDTSVFAQSAPRLWKYLQAHKNYFDARKSSIYRGKPPFSIFGIGDYSFKLFKVAISGLYKEPIFSLVLPIQGRPVMLDDTCYLLGFDTYKDALLTTSLLNSPAVKNFLQSIVFTDAKRPYTKDALMRIDLAQAASALSLKNLRDVWRALDFDPPEDISQTDIAGYARHLNVTHTL
jgi:hypothetical protein